VVREMRDGEMTDATDVEKRERTAVPHGFRSSYSTLTHVAHSETFCRHAPSGSPFLTSSSTPVMRKCGRAGWS
jgi:hypothetical protein